MKSRHSSTIQEERFQSGFDEPAGKPAEYIQPQKDFSKPQSKNNLVLGELNRGAKTFESIQKNTGFSNEELESILGDLEEKDMIKVQQKQGFFGPKIELHITDKGFKDFYT